jgi:hypothetical protein
MQNGTHGEFQVAVLSSFNMPTNSITCTLCKMDTCRFSNCHSLFCGRGRVIEKWGYSKWPLRSRNWTHMAFILWSAIKDKVYSKYSDEALQDVHEDTELCKKICFVRSTAQFPVTEGLIFGTNCISRQISTSLRSKNSDLMLMRLENV